MESKAERELREVLAQVKSKEFKYSPREVKEIDWSKYNAAQLSDLRFFLAKTNELVDRASALLPAKRLAVGRPPADAGDVAKAVLLMEYLQLPEESASEWTWIFKEKLHLEAELSPRTIGRGFENPDVQFILETVFKWTSAVFSTTENTVAIDATGVTESIKENYESVKHDNVKQAAGFFKLSIAIGTQCHSVSAYALTRGIADSPLFDQLIEETATRWPNVNTVCADAGYLSRDNCQTAADLSVAPFIFPKTGITLKTEGSPAWRSMLEDFTQATQTWLATYHLRSNVETVNSCLSRRFRKLSCRKNETKHYEELTRLILHNFRQWNQAQHQNQLKTI